MGYVAYRAGNKNRPKVAVRYQTHTWDRSTAPRKMTKEARTKMQRRGETEALLGLGPLTGSSVGLKRECWVGYGTPHARRVPCTATYRIKKKKQ